MTRQEIERMARLEECNAELAKENVELKATKLVSKPHLLFSERKKLAEKYKQWCDEADKKMTNGRVDRNCVETVISFLEGEGFCKIEQEQVKHGAFTNGDTSNLSGVEKFCKQLVEDGKLSQLPSNYDCATLKMYISHLEKENTELKARLEKAMELPFKVGDTVYLIRQAILKSPYKLELEETEIEKVILTKTGFRLKFKNNSFYETSLRTFNKTWFTYRTQAEQRLAELKKKGAIND